MSNNEIINNDKENNLVEKEDIEEQDKIEQMEKDEIEVKIAFKDKITYVFKGVGAILSSIIQTFGYFSILSLGYTTIYLISFRRYYNPNVNFSDNYNFIPLLNLSFCLSALIGSYFENRFGGKKTIILSNAILCLSFIIMYLSRSIYLDYILMILNGFGIAAGFNITKKNAISFFPNRKSLILGIINLFPNFLNLVLIMYNEVFVVNYKQELPSTDKIYYSESVFMNYQTLIIFEIGILFFTGLFACILYFKNDPKERAKLGFNEKIKEKENKEEKNEIGKNKKIHKKIKIKEALNNNRISKLMLMVLLFFPTINLITNNLRMDQYYYFIYGGLYNIIGCFFSLIFGILGDYIRFKILFSILAGLSIITSIVYIIYFEGEFILFFETILVSLIYNGFNIIFDSHIINVFGAENYIDIWAYIRAPEGISHLVGIILNCILDTNSPAYKIIYGISSLGSIISLLIGIHEGEDKFNYEN